MPTTDEELFFAYLEAESNNIHEMSGSIREDCAQLYEWAEWWARDKGYKLPTESQCGLYWTYSVE